MVAQTYDHRLRKLREAIVNHLPYTSGTVSVQENELLVYYGKKGHALGRVDFNDVSEDALAHLAQACDPASFGRNGEDVHDESYRKAGKLDRGAFAVDLDLEKSGLMDVIRHNLLDAKNSQNAIRAELYKLNVYGEGSFFKAHKDTPRKESMFGSLVVFYPTAHEGGNLLFRDGTSEWTFDSARATAEHDGPCVAYAAFFSDVDHEVSLVQSGYRVTVTYNLYFVDPTSSTPSPPSNLGFKSELQQLLEDPTFMPEGGHLGFGLRRVYPVMQKPKLKVSLDYLKPFLKGSDADILRACDVLRLKTGMWMVYSDSCTVAVSSAVSMEGFYMEERITSYLLEHGDAKRINHLRISRKREQDESHDEDQSSYDEDEDSDSDDEKERQISDNEVHDVRYERVYYQEGHPRYEAPAFEIQWVTGPSSVNVFRNALVTYGNEADIDYAYGHMSLFVEIGRPGERATVTA
ncbi:hypothetical protein EIP86_000934 [Pleurotus ostreatoroseus]|nr:hypothetical protein EIP86_000934 [Pleurotus ostreatoroseus]